MSAPDPSAAIVCPKCGRMCWRVMTGGPACIERRQARDSAYPASAAVPAEGAGHVASGEEFPDVPVRPGPLSEYVSIIGTDRQRLVLLVINGQDVTLAPFRARGLGRELIATADRIVRGER